MGEDSRRYREHIAAAMDRLYAGPGEGGIPAAATGAPASTNGFPGSVGTVAEATRSAGAALHVGVGASSSPQQLQLFESAAAPLYPQQP